MSLSPTNCTAESSVSSETVTKSNPGKVGSDELKRVVESALSRVLTLAAEAGKWDVVLAVTAELERRTVARAGSAGADLVRSVGRN